MAAQPFRVPRTAGANTRAAHGTRRGSTTSRRGARNPRMASTTSDSHGAVGSQSFDDDGFGDGSSFQHIDMGYTGGHRGPIGAATGARHPAVLAEESSSRGKPRIRAAAAWSENLPIVGEDDGAQEGIGDGSSGNSEWLNLRYGPPECLDQLEVMFEHVAVDGTTSCIPGEHAIGEGDEGDEGNSGGRFDFRSSSNHKRKGGNGTSSYATSPRKEEKMHMPKIMKGIWGTMQDHTEVVRKATHGNVLAKMIKKAMCLVVECGAPPGSRKHFMACQLFVKLVHREIFFTLKTNEQRLTWLKIWCKKEQNVVA